MEVYPKSFENLLESYKKLPGVGEKSAERMALATLDMSLEDVLKMSEALVQAKKELHSCPICGNLTDQEINLSSLISRVEKLEHPEIILALKSSIEGETTTLYIKKIFEKKDVVISRLAYGLPMGAEIEYLDMVTLDKALFDRKIISE